MLIDKISSSKKLLQAAINIVWFFFLYTITFLLVKFYINIMENYDNNIIKYGNNYNNNNTRANGNKRLKTSN